MTRVPDPLARAHHRVTAAASIEVLLVEVALFLQELPQQRLDALPPDCRPRRVVLQEDVLHWARRLARQRMLGAHGTRTRDYAIVHDFFAHAAGRAHGLRPRRDYEPFEPMPARAAPPWPRPSARPPS